MKFNARRAALALPGVTGTARVGRRTSTVLPRLRRGDIAVIDHVDLDRDTAAALVDAGVAAVVNVAPMISGRYANLGPEVLAEAGVVVVDRVGPAALERIPDESSIRICEGRVYLALPDGQPEVVATGRELDLAMVQSEMGQARTGLVVQLEALAQGTSDFLRREQELLLNGRGLPALVTPVAGRPAVVVADAAHPDLTTIGGFVRDQSPAMVAIGRAADDLLGLSWVPDVVVVTGGDPGSVPSLDALRLAKEVVVLAPRGAGRAEVDRIERLGVRMHRVESGATAEDVALLLLDHHEASLIVGVGLRSRLEDFLDRPEAGPGSAFATRLKVGSRLVDVSVLPLLYSGRARPLHVLLLTLAGFVALVAAIGVTPVGHDWGEGILDYLQGLV